MILLSYLTISKIEILEQIKRYTEATVFDTKDIEFAVIKKLDMDPSKA